MNDRALITKSMAITAAMSYNEMVDGANPKSLIRELCRRMGRRCVTIEKGSGGYRMISYNGQARFLTFTESLLWRFFNLPPEGHYVVPVEVELDRKPAFDVHPE